MSDITKLVAEIERLARDVLKIKRDLDEFDGDRSGHLQALLDAREALAEAVSPDNILALLSALSGAAEVARRDALAWAIERWDAEVRNRPLVNVHRRSLDDAWRQVIRHFGGDDRALIGLPHDELLAPEKAS